jgi:hypothetical protein
MKISMKSASAIVTLLGAVLVSGDAITATANPAPAHAFSPAPHAPAPLIENPGAGPVSAAAQVVPILFAADPHLADLTAFYQKLGVSSYLPASLSEYGVGRPTISAPVIRTDPPPATIDDLTASNWILDQIASGALPPEGGNTIYALAFPSSTQVSSGQVTLTLPGPLCGGTNGTTTEADGTPVPFTLSALCAASVTRSGLSEAAYDLSIQASALAAALTDPDSFLNFGYYSFSWSGSAWAPFAFSVSQMCGTLRNESATWTPSDLGYPVPRLWSDTAARGSHDPCAVPTDVPAPYFNAAPDVGGIWTNQYSILKGVYLPPGGEVTIPVRLFSDRPTAPWMLGAVERTDLIPDPGNVLSFSFDEMTGRNGDVRRLTIRRAASGSANPTDGILFEITSQQGTTTHEWFVMVGSE